MGADAVTRIGDAALIGRHRGVPVSVGHVNAVRARATACPQTTGDPPSPTSLNYPNFSSPLPKLIGLLLVP